MFRSAQPSVRRAGSFVVSVLFHLILLLIFPHLSSVFEGTVVGEGSLGGGQAVRVVTLQPWSPAATTVVASPGHGHTPNSSPTPERPAPGRPQRQQTRAASNVTPAIPASSVSPATTAAQATPTELLTSPTGKVLVNAEPAPAPVTTPPSNPAESRLTPPSAPIPTTPASTDTKPGAAGNPGGLSTVPAPPPNPPVGEGPWLAGPAPQYPKNAQNSGVEGTVVGQVLITASGQISVRLVSSSGSPLLDRQAVGTIADRWQSTYRPPAGWVTVVGWQAHFSRQDGYQVRTSQDEAFNVQESQIPPAGPVSRPEPAAVGAATAR